MDKFEIETALLTKDVTAAESVIAALAKNITSLQEAKTKLSSMWEGQAKDQMVASVEADIAALAELVNAMKRFVANTSEARASYDRCEVSVGQLVDDIRV